MALVVSLSLLLCIKSPTFSQDTLHEDVLLLNYDTRQFLIDSFLFTGVAFDTFYGGQLKQIGSYDHGLRTGAYSIYFKNGQIQASEHYCVGRRHGSSKTWYDNGQIKSQIFYNNGLIEGEYLRW